MSWTSPGSAGRQPADREALLEPGGPVGRQPADRETPLEPGGPRVFARVLPVPSKWDLARRAMTIANVVRRNLFGFAIGSIVHRRRSGGLAPAMGKTCFQLGGTFAKFGQLVASAPGMFGADLAAEFRSCLDTGPPVLVSEVRAIVEADLGCPIEDLFSSFSEVPIGRASIAVVHRAVVHDGREVAVKVLRPGIDRAVAVDLELLQPLVGLVARQTGDVMAGALLQMIDGFRVQIGEELDLRNEARAITYFRSMLDSAGLPLIVIPDVHLELSGPRVLTMELLGGSPIDDLVHVEAYGVDPAPLVEQLLHFLFVACVEWGVFHGDIHAGNLMLLPDGRVGVLDWGIVGRLDTPTRQFLLRLLEAVLGDERAWTDVSAHIVDTYGPAVTDGMGLDGQGLTALIRSMLEPALLRPFGELSLATLMTTPQVSAAQALGVEIKSRSFVDLMRRFAIQRRIRRMAEAHGGVSSDFDRGTMLLAKQLMYFELYGKLFLGDRALLSDRDFFVGVARRCRSADERLSGGHQAT